VILADSIERERGVVVDNGSRGVWKHFADDEHDLVDGPACVGSTRRRIVVNMVDRV
jgi:hypothetical protein